MTDISDLIEVIEDQHKKVLAIRSDRIAKIALDIAYYSAMIDAAKDDPLDETDRQEAILAYLTKQQTELVEFYQTLVNDELP